MLCCEARARVHHLYAGQIQAIQIVAPTDHCICIFSFLHLQSRLNDTR